MENQEFFNPRRRVLNAIAAVSTAKLTVKLTPMPLCPKEEWGK
jgi:hypothetical protein